MKQSGVHSYVIAAHLRVRQGTCVSVCLTQETTRQSNTRVKGHR
jgi:hypothetical protein